MITIKQIGEALKELLGKREMTYQELSNRTKISKPYIAEIISTNRIPAKEKIEKIAAAFEINPFYFREYRLGILTEYLQDNPHYLAVENKEELIEMLDYRKHLEEARDQKEMLQKERMDLEHRLVETRNNKKNLEKNREVMMRQNRIMDFIMEATGKVDVNKLSNDDMELVVRLLERLSKK